MTLADSNEEQELTGTAGMGDVGAFGTTEVAPLDLPDIDQVRAEGAARSHEGDRVPPEPGGPQSQPPTGDRPAGGAAVGSTTSAGGSHRDLRLLADIQLELTVELGRSRIPMRDLLSLGPGSVLELDQPVTGPVDVLVNGTVVARGEVFVVDGEFGVRITELKRRP